ncbi:hypothetical protein [Polluticoccus soli]|uniref:hypothetical protein n=1 Tax=Polluticoccus soli TaxID=3034150 RepID=UPI0023E2BE0F|nr:hypothetical protein [Flavipsychrobacter sp. JY13-12]
MENNSMAIRKVLSGTFVGIGICGTLLILWTALTGIYKGKSVLGSTKTITGKVAEVSEGGAYDAVFHLEQYKSTFYINRGLQYYDFTLEGLMQLSKGKEVTISYVSQLSPFDMEGRSGHMNRLVIGDSVVFDEMKGIPAYKE